jgi:serine/threonine-protein kinase HipA
VGTYFRLDEKQMDTIIKEVNQATSNWKTIAKDHEIPRGEIELMTKAFMK